MVLGLHVESPIGGHQAGINRPEKLRGSNFLKGPAFFQNDYFPVLSSNINPPVSHQRRTPDPTQGIMYPHGFPGLGVYAMNLPGEVRYIDQPILD